MTNVMFNYLDIHMQVFILFYDMNIFNYLNTIYLCVYVFILFYGINMFTCYTMI